MTPKLSGLSIPFTSLPVNLASDVVKTELQQSDVWKKTTTLTETLVLVLLEFLMANNYFTYEWMHYRQVFGCAMGSPVSSVIADLAVLSDIEKWALSTTDEGRQKQENEF